MVRSAKFALLTHGNPSGRAIEEADRIRIFEEYLARQKAKAEEKEKRHREKDDKDKDKVRLGIRVVWNCGQIFRYQKFQTLFGWRIV